MNIQKAGPLLIGLLVHLVLPGCSCWRDTQSRASHVYQEQWTVTRYRDGRVVEERRVTETKTASLPPVSLAP